MNKQTAIEKLKAMANEPKDSLKKMDGTYSESVHSHPGFDYNPSGFADDKWNKSYPTFRIAYTNAGDKGSSINNKAISKYVYSTWLKRNAANGGYVKYNYNEAVYTGKK